MVSLIVIRLVRFVLAVAAVCFLGLFRELGQLVVKIGGPAYRIGMGGGAASSVPSGSNNADLDFNAVQRGDAEMSQKLWRVVRSCVEMGDKNPIVQIHDQGAGGNCNVVKVRT